MLEKGLDQEALVSGTKLEKPLPRGESYVEQRTRRGAHRSPDAMSNTRLDRTGSH